MSIRYLAVLGVGTFLVWAATEGDVLKVTAWVAIYLVGYWFSLIFHPRRACWWCRGAGRHIGAVFRYGHRPCTSCDGRGWEIRLGARLLTPHRAPGS